MSGNPNITVCGRCGTTNPPGVTACAECGAPLVAPDSTDAGLRAVEGYAEQDEGREAQVPPGIASEPEGWDPPRRG